MKQPRPLSDLVDQVRRQSPLSEGLERQRTLDCWPEVVGDVLARRSRALSLNEGTLLVQVDGSVWAQELALLRPRIVQELERRLGPGAVREVRFHSGREIL